MDQLPIYHTDRLTLRPLYSSDRVALFTIYGDAEVMRYAADPPFPDTDTIDLMLASVAALAAAGSAYEWGIELRSTATLIGTCGLHSFAEPPHAAEIGCLLARAFWGRGLMHETLTGLISVASRDFGLRELRADIDADNARSLRLFRRLGFQPLHGTLLVRSLDADGCNVVAPIALH
jgi:ribosomal-protein-alanine N-acetyltransferase